LFLQRQGIGCCGQIRFPNVFSVAYQDSGGNLLWYAFWHYICISLFMYSQALRHGSLYSTICVESCTENCMCLL
jgi:hypothetical protein